MTKRKKWQHSLLLTAALVTVFFLHAPALHISRYRALLYVLCVLLPQVVALIVQFMEVRDRYAAFRKPEEGAFTASHTKSRPPRRRAPIYTRNIAAIKCSGIHPNRAGPALAFM